MKMLAAFISILMLLSSFDVCAISGGCTELEESQYQLYGDENGQENTESCAPFCFCTHCICSIVIPEQVKVMSVIPAFKTEFLQSDESASQNTYFSIWQPPKMCS